MNFVMACYSVACVVILVTHEAISPVNGQSTVQGSDNEDPLVSIFAEMIQQLRVNLFEQLNKQVQGIHTILNASFQDMKSDHLKQGQSMHELLNESFNEIKSQHDAIVTNLQAIDRRLEEHDIFIKNQTRDSLEEHISIRNLTHDSRTSANGTCDPASDVCDCSDMKASGNTRSGVYEVCVRHQLSRTCTSAFCDMETANSASLVFQRRKDGSVNFNRTWIEYRNGFGNPDGELWLGNEMLYLLTSKRNYKLRVELEDFGGNRSYAEYSTFSISSSTYNYTLTVGGYSGTAGESMNYNNGKQFSTLDAKNDDAGSRHCARQYGGGWWYSNCAYAHLNGLYRYQKVCSAKQDLTFIVDGSGSICPAQPCENWNFTRQFIHRIVNSMTIGQNDTTVTVIIFSTVSTVQWNFAAHTNKTSLLNAIDNLPFPDGSTAIVPALDLLTSTVYTADQGDRPDISDTAIIITDGKPKEPIPDLKDAINKVHSKGIRTLVVGVTENINIETLSLLSSPPRKENETFFTAQDYSSLDTIRDELRSRTCNTTTEDPGTCGSRSEVCDCSDIKASGQTASGVYEVCAGLQRDRVCFKAFCDIDTDNRTSLVFQRRKDGKVNFYRTWAEYKEGFGDLSGEFWLGNEKLYLLTSKRNYKLRIALEDWEGNKRFAEYGRFSISSSVQNYTLDVGGYSGNAGDSLTYHNGQQFSTKDVDNHISNSTSCAVLYRGAWWYNTCQQSNLNGIYHRGNYSGSAVNAEGVQWNTWPGRWYSLKSTEMKLVPTA